MNAPSGIFLETIRDSLQANGQGNLWTGYLLLSQH